VRAGGEGALSVRPPRQSNFVQQRGDSKNILQGSRMTLSRSALALVWFFFGIIFLALGFYHYTLIGQRTPAFSITERPLTGVSIGIAGMDIDEPLRRHADAINAYVQNQDESSSRSNRVSFFGYVAATLTAFLSAALEFVNRKEGC